VRIDSPAPGPGLLKPEIRIPKAEQPAPVLTVEELTVELPARGAMRPAVDRVWLALSEGEGVALVGESGCGKTQLVRAILGLAPDGGRVSGRVRLAGRDLLTLSDREWGAVRGREIGIVFQEPASALDPVRTLGEHLVEAVRLHAKASRRQARQVALEALQAVSFPDPILALDAYPHRLSGGLRQRACLAIALAPGPRVLLADEPTASLDATVALQILDLLDRLRRERGLAVLLVTHDLGLVARHCERVVVLYAGRVVEEAETAALFRDPGHPYTRGLLRSAPRLLEPARRPGERYETLAGAPPGLSARASGSCAFEPRCPDRFEPCALRDPALFPHGSGRARCFLHEPIAGRPA
jgi:oligopeptide/dipeptide ABC transporter ATP-binding protein